MRARIPKLPHMRRAGCCPVPVQARAQCPTWFSTFTCEHVQWRAEGGPEAHEAQRRSTLPRSHAMSTLGRQSQLCSVLLAA
eukprot:338779-Chlamydomonas_euryale.AAC.2